MNSKPNPCKFCGREAVVASLRGNGEPWEVYCPNSECPGEPDIFVYDFGNDAEKMINAWNKLYGLRVSTVVFDEATPDGWGTCSLCGGDVYFSDAFCSGCGARIEAEQNG